MRPNNRTDFGIAIICALPLEADAVEALFDEHYDRLGRYYGKQQGDMNTYINGRIGKHNVVLAFLPGIGRDSAASVSSSLQVSYPGVKLALLVGICGGAPPPPKYQEIFLGDVIVSDSVIKYDFGRQYPGGFERKTGVLDTLGRPDREIRTLLNSLRTDHGRKELQEQTQHYYDILQQGNMKWHHPAASDILFESSYLHKHHGGIFRRARCSCSGSEWPDHICEEALRKDCNELECDKNRQVRFREASKASPISIHIGPVASADTVMKSGMHRDEMVRKEKVIGFEMEGAGVWDNIPCIIVKGICDYADSHKRKPWQAYAAATGASVAKALLECWMPANHSDTSRPVHSMIPFARNHQFVGRQEEIRQSENLMSASGCVRKHAIFGLGGVGKTQVALELAYRVRDREPECSIFWIPCTSHEATEQAFLAIAQMLGIQETKPTEVKECVKNHLNQTKQKWLLIFDNADDMWEGSTLGSFLTHNDQGHIIFTTRNRKLAVYLASSYVIHVRELDEKSGLEFLAKRLIEKSLLDDRQAVITLLKQLTFLPLAIAQAASYINQNGDVGGVSEYVLLLEEQETDVVELLSEDFGDDQRYKETENAVAMTWLISFRQVQKLEPLAFEYLLLMACVNPLDIPRLFLPLATSRKKMIDALGLLSAYSFVEVPPANKSMTMHRLVRLATRNWMRNEQQFSLYIARAADRLVEVLPEPGYGNRQLWREFLPHALSVLGESAFDKQGNGIVLLAKVGLCLFDHGRYDEAEKLFTDVVAIRRGQREEKHRSTLASMVKLAEIISEQGRRKEAEELAMLALKTQKEVLGLEHQDTLGTMAWLITVYQQQGQLKKAEELGLQTLETSERVLSAGHTLTLQTKSRLARVFSSQERWVRAGLLERRSLEGHKKALGPEHPETLASMANMALICRGLRQWQQAEDLLLQTIEISKRVVGLEHPETLVSMADLASLYRCQGQLKEAEELGNHVLSVQKRVLRPGHPHTLSSMNSLASTYQKQHRYKRAAELGEQSLIMHRHVLGLENPFTLASMHNLAHTWYMLARKQDAFRLMRECVELCRRVLGPVHPDTTGASRDLSEWEELERTREIVIECPEQ